ncbi:MAG: hypothetical protein AB8G99_16020 [Planctomycetaceae bacterium]
MEIEEPVVGYIAESNIEATLLQHFLAERDIQSHVIVDNSLVGESLWGRTTLHRPKLWVSKQNLERGHEFLIEFEATKSARDQATAINGNIPVVCDACGKTTNFPASLRGNTENCPHCGNFVDIGEPDETWNGVDFGEPES